MVMAAALLFTAAMTFFGVYTFYYSTEIKLPDCKNKYTLFYILLSGFLIRIIASLCYPGHPTDIACFNAWSNFLTTEGFASFYTSDMFADYPPGYMYILYIVGFLKNIFSYNSIFAYSVLKLPAMLADILCAVIIYKLAEKKLGNKIKYLITGFFLFNPAVILNSAVWGQVDSVFTLFVLLMFVAILEKRMILSYFIFALSIFMKPQALFYAPVLGFAIIENVFLDNYSNKKVIKNLLGGISAILILFILAKPFGISNVISQYISTLESYNFVTVNAYNFWGALGLNWTPSNYIYSILGYLSIAITVVLSAFIYFKSEKDNRLFITSAFICLSVFMFSIKMHERYAFPAIVFLLCSFAVSFKKKEMYFYIATSALQFLNAFHVLFFYKPEVVFETQNIVYTIAISWLNVIFFVLFFIYLMRKNMNIPLCLKAKENANFFENKTEMTLQKNIAKKDIIAMIIITLIYSTVALYNLGDIKAPQSFEKITENKTITIDYGEEKDISGISLYLGALNIDDQRTVHIDLKDDLGKNLHSFDIDSGDVFAWNTYQDFSVFARYIQLTASDTVYVGELGTFSSGGQLVYPAEAPTLLIDEQDLVQKHGTYLNGTYFDEIYHARTAYEFTENLPVYEWTHPPLGKIFISLGINIFGMTPFGWRIIGTLFGILMIPILYIFSKKMFGSTFISVISAILISSDFMHFTQTRIATIDVYITFFVILMYYFMYKYVTEDVGKKDVSKTYASLLFAGVSMGLGIACKWTGAYAGAGLAVIFFVTIALKHIKGRIDTPNVLKTFGMCVIFFVLIPAIIYVLSYIPFLRSNNGEFMDIVQNQIDMFAYHSDTVVSSTHPFSSQWYKWLIDYRPIWYYSGINGTLTENISAFGNPIIWISGLLAFVYCVYDGIRNHNKNAVFLVIAYLAQLIPWVFVERTTFIYHYFPCVPFLVLMISHLINRVCIKKPNAKKWFILFAVISVFLFIMFYPAISGFPVDGDYVNNYLKWLPSWKLI